MLRDLYREPGKSGIKETRNQGTGKGRHKIIQEPGNQESQAGKEPGTREPGKSGIKETRNQETRKVRHKRNQESQA